MTPPPSGGYGFVRALMRLVLGLFYRRIEVVGEENIPAQGPLILAANHHNALVDGMLLIATVGRPLRALAKAPLFRHPLIGPFLRLIGGLPVNRRKESGDDPAKNAALFAATTAALRAGEAIMIFPEGTTQPEPVLQDVRTGAARMLLAAQAADPDTRVTLLPVGLVFDQPGTFRSGRALVLIGRPVDTAGFFDTSIPSARGLTERLADALRAQIVEADDRRTLRLLQLVEELWREGEGAPAPGDAARVQWMQGAMRIYRRLQQSDSERVSALRRELEAYDLDSEKAGLAAEHLSRNYSFATVARFVITEGASLLVAAPLALCGILIHAIPYQLTALAERLIPHTDEEDATDKIAAGLVFYPLAWIAEAWAAFGLGGRTALLVFLVALLPTGFLALAWSERLDHARKEARAFLRFLRDPDLPSRLRQRREALARELRALALLADQDPKPPSGERDGTARL